MAVQSLVVATVMLCLNSSRESNMLYPRHLKCMWFIEIADGQRRRGGKVVKASEALCFPFSM